MAHKMQLSLFQCDSSRGVKKARETTALFTILCYVLLSECVEQVSWVCHLSVLSMFWCPLWFITVQSHGNMGSICFIQWRSKNFNGLNTISTIARMIIEMHMLWLVKECIKSCYDNNAQGDYRKSAKFQNGCLTFSQMFARKW